MSEENQGNEQQQFQHPPHLINVYFKELPQFDYDEMKAYLLDMDPTGPQSITIEENERGFQFKFDEVEVQAIRMPERDEQFAQFISQAEQQFPADFREAVGSHQTGFQVIVGNVAACGPLEAQITLLKVAVALCDQEGLCVLFPFSGTILPAQLLEEAANTLFGGKEDGCDCHEHDDSEDKECDCDDDCECENESLTIWEMLRQHGEPQILLMNIAVFQDPDKHHWMISRGLTFCGLPDILFKLDAQEEMQVAQRFIEGALAVQISNRQAFNLDMVVEYDENTSYKLVAPPQIQVPFPTFGCLFAEKVQSNKSKIEIVKG